MGGFPPNGLSEIQTFYPFKVDTWNFQDKQKQRKDKIWQNLGVPKWRDPPQTRTPKFKTEPLTLDW